MTLQSQYESMLSRVFYEGRMRSDRTGTGTTAMFGLQERWDLNQGFPLVTTKKVFLKGVIAELLWMLSGDTNITPLQEQGVHIWDEWADKNGNLGPVYGEQWRSWEYPDPTCSRYDMGFKYADQMKDLIERLKKDPDSRRHVVSAWNVGQLDEMALAPCHCLFQLDAEPLTLKERKARLRENRDDEYARMTDEKVVEYLDSRDVPKYRLSCQLYQRSADMFLGVPFNIASYALLTMMVAQQVNMVPGDFIWTGGNCHIYDNHRDQVREQLTRDIYPFPVMRIDKAKDLFSYKPEDFHLTDYQHHPAIKAPVAV